LFLTVQTYDDQIRTNWIIRAITCTEQKQMPKTESPTQTKWRVGNIKSYTHRPVKGSLTITFSKFKLPLQGDNLNGFY